MAFSSMNSDTCFRVLCGCLRLQNCNKRKEEYLFVESFVSYLLCVRACVYMFMCVCFFIFSFFKVCMYTCVQLVCVCTVCRSS